MVENRDLRGQFRFHRTFKNPQQADRLNLIFKHVVNDQRFKKTLNYQHQRKKNSSSFNVRRLDYQLSSNFTDNKLSRSLDDTTRDSANSHHSKITSKSYLSEKSLDEDYERELNMHQKIYSTPEVSQRKKIQNSYTPNLRKLFPIFQ